MLARRYAKALLTLAEKQKNSDRIKDEISEVGRLAKQRRYFDFFTNRLIDAADKLEPLKGLLPLTKDFLKLVIRNKRERLLFLISKEYTDIYNKRNGLVDVEVVSKEALDDKQKARLRSKLERSTKKKALMSYSTDRTITGGMRIMYEDKIIDGTISGMLKEMLKEMEGA